MEKMWRKMPWGRATIMVHPDHPPVVVGEDESLMVMTALGYKRLSKGMERIVREALAADAEPQRRPGAVTRYDPKSPMAPQILSNLLRGAADAERRKTKHRDRILRAMKPLWSKLAIVRDVPALMAVKEAIHRTAKLPDHAVAGLELTTAQKRELLIIRRLETLGVGESVWMPWGEKVTLMPDGATRHLIELTEEQAVKVRELVADDAERQLQPKTPSPALSPTPTSSKPLRKRLASFFRLR